MAIHPQVRVVVRPFGSVAAVIAFLSRDTMRELRRACSPARGS
jgi:hypothetical protein